MKLSAGIHQYWQRLLLQPQQHGPDSAHFASNGLLELRWFWHTRARHATSTAQFAEPTALPCLLTKCLSDQVRALLFRQYKDTSAVHATPRRLVGRPTRHTALFWAFAAGMTGHTRLITVCPWQESLHNHEYSCALASVMLGTCCCKLVCLHSLSYFCCCHGDLHRKWGSARRPSLCCVGKFKAQPYISITQVF